ncbi:MAG: putative Holliday junction resolvase [Moritella dasanensis]|jgi:putative Holliday junction resolvase|uniref:Holliday junction resolvase RuvX n=1 Tax=Moritella TaxID=58050 RepID=UPI0002F593C3|nr:MULTISPECIES: Holliday junction resolvase RuvX [Moritella]MDX2319033.1 Holliday junction resolvase RuvX [Moritella sp.]PKH09675.1 Holliday junction resolvase RuvX [Moritella sp. Urea-trap-13]
MSNAESGQRTLLGFDFGTKSIGIAVGQEITGTARPLVAFKANDGIPDWDLIEQQIKEWQPDLVIVGKPLNMDGTEQEITKRAIKFANRLTGRFNVKTEMHDERLTTKDAKARLFEEGGFKALQKGAIDSASAMVILEGWMESQYGAEL